MSHIKSNPGTLCKSKWHTKAFCTRKPKKPIKPKRDTKWSETRGQWFKDNPPNLNGVYICYLQISELCPKRLTPGRTTLDHIVPRGRGKQYKYDVNNLRPSCFACNSLKGSQTLETLAKTYPHLNKYLT